MKKSVHFILTLPSVVKASTQAAASTPRTTSSDDLSAPTPSPKAYNIIFYKRTVHENYYIATVHIHIGMYQHFLEVAIIYNFV